MKYNLWYNVALILDLPEDPTESQIDVMEGQMEAGIRKEVIHNLHGCYVSFDQMEEENGNSQSG